MKASLSIRLLSSVIAGFVAGLVYFASTVAFEAGVTPRTVILAVVVGVATFIVAFLVNTFLVRKG